jgi:hypothetical protein
MMGRFNRFLQNVVLRISEARDLGDSNRYKFYEHLKPYQASPPEVLSIDEKFIPVYPILNCVGIVITTNHQVLGIYLSPEDRRYFVCWSDLKSGDFPDDYWNRIQAFFDNGGYGHVAAFLRQRDLSGFDPKKPPLKTAAFWNIVQANQPVMIAIIEDRIDALSEVAKAGPLPAVTLDMLKGDGTSEANETLHNWLNDDKNKRLAAHYLEQIGYVAHRNILEKTRGFWIVGKKRQTIYVRKELNPEQRTAAVAALVNQGSTGA